MASGHLSKLKGSSRFPLPRTVLALFRRQSRDLLGGHVTAYLRPRANRSNWRIWLLRVPDVDFTLMAYLASFSSVLSLISFTQTFADSTAASGYSPTRPPAPWRSPVYLMICPCSWQCVAREVRMLGQTGCWVDSAGLKPKGVYWEAQHTSLQQTLIGKACGIC